MFSLFDLSLSPSIVIARPIVLLDSASLLFYSVEVFRFYFIVFCLFALYIRVYVYSKLCFWGVWCARVSLSHSPVSVSACIYSLFYVYFGPFCSHFVYAIWVSYWIVDLFSSGPCFYPLVSRHSSADTQSKFSRRFPVRRAVFLFGVKFHNWRRVMGTLLSSMWKSHIKRCHGWKMGRSGEIARESVNSLAADSAPNVNHSPLGPGRRGNSSWICVAQRKNTGQARASQNCLVGKCVLVA